MTPFPNLSRVSPVLAVVVAIGAGCAREAPKPLIRPATEAEVDTFVDALMGAAERGALDDVVGLFRVEATLAIGRAQLSPAERADLAEGLRSGLSKNGSLPSSLIAIAGDGGTWRVFREPGPVFGRFVDERWIHVRLLPADGRFEHVALRLGAFERDPVGVVDFQLLSNGESLSTTARRLVDSLRKESRITGLIARLTKSRQVPSSLERTLEAAMRIQDLTNAGDPVGALEVFAALPEGAKSHRLVLMARLHAASDVDLPAYQRAIEDMRRHLADDPAWLMLAIDDAMANDRPADGLAALAKLRGATIDDPYLAALEAEFLVDAGRFDEADAALRRGEEREPTLEDFRYTRGYLLFHRGAFDDAAAHYARMIDDGMDLFVDDLAGIAGSEAFVASPAFEKLRRRYPAERPLADEEPAIDVEELMKNAELVVSASFVREPGFLYVLDDAGDIVRFPKTSDVQEDNASPHELVKKLGVVRAPGHLYFLNERGDVLRAKVPVD